MLWNLGKGFLLLQLVGVAFQDLSYKRNSENASPVAISTVVSIVRSLAASPVMMVPSHF